MNHGEQAESVGHQTELPAADVRGHPGDGRWSAAAAGQIVRDLGDHDHGALCLQKGPLRRHQVQGVVLLRRPLHPVAHC